METQLIEQIITGFPNLMFAALLSLALWRIIQTEQKKNARLIELLIRAYEMCDDPAAPAAARARRTQEVAAIIREDD